MASKHEHKTRENHEHGKERGSLGKRDSNESCEECRRPSKPVIPDKELCQPKIQLDFCAIGDYSQELVQLVGASNQFSPASKNNRLGGTQISFSISFTPKLNEAHFKLIITGVDKHDKIEAAHIHYGESNVNGPILVTLFKKPTHDCNDDGYDRRRHENKLTVQGTIKNKNIVHFSGGSNYLNQINTVASIYQAIRKGAIYVNAHTEKFPNGVARAQIF